MNPLKIALLALALTGCSPPPDDVSFLPPLRHKGKLFSSYNPVGKSVWSNNWTSRFDLTGVAWNDRRTVTAISRRHVVMAAHFIRPSSVPAIFHDREGNAHIRFLHNIQRFDALGDIAVAELKQTLPPGVTHYPLAEPQDATYRRAVLVTDQTMHLSVHRVGSVAGRRVILGNDPEIDRTYWRNLVSGDSGNPGFIIRNGRLHLLTTFTTGGSGAGPFFGDPEIRAALAPFR